MLKILMMMMMMTCIYSHVFSVSITISINLNWLTTQQVTWLVVTEVQSGSFRMVTECRHYNACPIYGSAFYVRQVLLFIVECGIVHFLGTLCTLCMYSKFRHHPHRLGYLYAKFCFFRSSHSWASPWRKFAYSITHPAYLMCWDTT